MLRTILVVSMVLIARPALCQSCIPPPQYAASLSASPEDPGVGHVASVPEEFSVYLWMTCGIGEGLQGANILEAIIETDYAVIAFEPMNGWLNGGDFQTLLMVRAGCQLPPALVGRLTLGNPNGLSSGEVCLRSGPDFPAPPPSFWVADCCDWWQFPTGDLAGVSGFAVGNAIPCFDDLGCTGPTAVDPETWGRLKARYRLPSN